MDIHGIVSRHNTAHNISRSSNGEKIQHTIYRTVSCIGSETQYTANRAEWREWARTKPTKQQTTQSMNNQTLRICLLNEVPEKKCGKY